MKIIAAIPARYQATRFPGKLMQRIGEKTVIARTYEQAVKSGLFDEVVVATDSQIIKNELEAIGGKVVMTSAEHQSGSDRIAEAVKDIDADVVVNIQGDEPFIQTESLAKLIEVFREDSEKKVDLATLAQPITSLDEINNPNCVKLVISNSGNALYFSRAKIPFEREENSTATFYKHIGVYAYRKQALMDFVQLPMSDYEKVEKLEQLRYLENDYVIKVVKTQYSTIGIDTPEDLEKAIDYFKKMEQ